MEIRGHEICIYAGKSSEINTRMFYERGFTIHDLALMNEMAINNSDLIICSIHFLSKVFTVKKYIFIYDLGNIFGCRLVGGADVVMTPGFIRYDPDIRDTNVTATVGMFSRKLSDIQEENQILFIDSGHFPFGIEGKKIIATLILDICEKCQDYTVKIKPRFLKKDMVMTHKNSVHLYDVINEVCNDSLPPNLVLMDEYGDLDELVCQSSLILCMYTSACLTAFKYNKKVIVIGNIPSSSTIDSLNGFTFKRVESLLKESGCVVDYHKVLEIVPNGYNCDNTFKNKYLGFVNGEENITQTAKFIEYCYNYFINKGNFICPSDVDLYNYKEKLMSDKGMDWAQIIRLRIKNELYRTVCNYRDMINHEIDISEQLKWIDCHVSKVNTEDEKEIKDLLNNNVITDLFVLGKWNEIKGDGGAESYYLNALYNVDKTVFLEKDFSNVRCQRSLYYFKGMVHLNEGDTEQGVDLLKKYLSETDKATYNEFLTDIDDYYSVVFPFHKVEKGTTIILYGFGYVCRCFLHQIQKSNYCKIAGIVDNSVENNVCYKDIPVMNTDMLESIKCDYIIISLAREKRIEVAENLSKFNIDPDKLVT